MLAIVLPKGSLEKQVLELFSAADLHVVRGGDRDYHARVDDPRIDKVRFLRPQEIPTYVEQGIFDLGISGRDWVSETGSSLRKAGLKIIATLLTSRTELLANREAYEDPAKRAAMDDLVVLLQGALRARGGVRCQRGARRPARLAVELRA